MSIPGFTAEASFTVDKHNYSLSSIVEYLDKDENILPARGGPGTCQPGIDKCSNYQRRIWHIDCTYTTEPCSCSTVCATIDYIGGSVCLLMCEDDDPCKVVAEANWCTSPDNIPYYQYIYTCKDGSSHKQTFQVSGNCDPSTDHGFIVYPPAYYVP